MDEPVAESSIGNSYEVPRTLRHAAIQASIKKVLEPEPSQSTTQALSNPGVGGNSWYFRMGVFHYKVSISTLPRIFDEKVGPFTEFLCLMEVSKIRF